MVTNQVDVMKFDNLSDEEWYELQYTYWDHNPPFNMQTRRKVFQEVYYTICKVNSNIWLTGGSLLGAIRDEDFIKWDDDIDFDMMELDFIESKSDLKMVLNKCGYIVRTTENQTYPKMVAYKNGVKIAIGALREEGDMLTRPCYQLPKKFFTKETNIHFMDIDVLVPFPPEEFLGYVYGTDWKIPRKVDDDIELYTMKYLRCSNIRIVIKRTYFFLIRLFRTIKR